MENEVLNYVSQLFNEFGYWSIALIVATTLLMIPVNMLVKKIFSKNTNESVVRVSKVSSQLLVFGISAVCITIFCLIMKTPLSVNFVFANVLPCGFLSMVLWAVLKVARDMGIKPIIKIILESQTVKKALKEIKIDDKIKDAIFNKLVELVENSDGENAKLVIEKEMEIVNIATSMLSGFTDNPNAVATQFAEALKIKFKEKEN